MKELKLQKANGLASFVEVSSKTNLNIDNSFKTIVDLILKYSGV
jgi:GTPase SAR1 family protein